MTTSNYSDDTIAPLVHQKELLDRVRGNRDAFRRLLDKFLEVYPQMMAQVREAILAEDREALKHASHKLNGAVANLLGEHRIKAIPTLNAFAQNGNLNAATVVWQEAEQKMEQLAVALRSMLQGIGE